MTQGDTEAVLQSLVQSDVDEVSEEALWGPPHLEWVLITAVESLSDPDADSSETSDERGVVTYWVTPDGLFKAVVDVLGQDKTLPLAALGTAAWPFPDQVTMIGLEHWVRVTTRGLDDELLTTWTFQYPDAKLHLIKGVSVSKHHPGAAENGAEAFARSIASKVGWRSG